MLGLWHVAHLERTPTTVDVPFCVSCGGEPTERVPVAALGRVTAPYCAGCAQRAREREWRLPFALMGVGALLPFPAALFPWSSPGAALEVALAIAFFGAIAAIAYASFRLRPDGAASGPAIRAHKLVPVVQFDCSRKDVAEALVKACGGHVASRRSLRATIALAVVPLVLACFTFGFAGAQALFLSTLEIDCGGTEGVFVSVDGREAERVTAGQHDSVLVRHGSRAIAWTKGKRHVERTIVVERGHDLLLNPGPTTCYWKRVGVYKPEHSKTLTPDEAQEAAKAGPLPVVELHVLPHVSHWFEEMPQRKPDEPLDSNIAVGVVRDLTCSKLVSRECAPGTVEAFLECESKATTQDEAHACYDKATAFCSPE